MLRIHQSVSAAQAKQYYTQSLDRGDYYTREAERPGQWFGLGAERLGLSGEVSREDFFALLENRNPASGSRLSARDLGDRRRPGWDLVFSPPKGVSVLRAIGDERIADAMMASAKETLAELEAEAIRTRQRRGGQNDTAATGNLVASLFFHDTTRELADGRPDPHDHIHAFVHNATWVEHESRWQAAELYAAHIDRPYYEAAFEARLAAKLGGLGYAVERRADGWDIAGISQQVLSTFSRRTTEIEAAAKRLGVETAAEKGGLGARTRRKKNAPLPAQDLRRYWDGKLSPEERATLARIFDHARTQPQRTFAGESHAATASLGHAVEHLFARDSTVALRSIQAEALRYGIGRVTPEQVRSELDRLPLLTQAVGGRVIATTEEVLAEERQMLRFARDGRGACDPLGGYAPYAFRRDFLNAGQRRAVTELLTSFDRVQVLRGLAGVGKSTALAELRDGVTAQGRQVLAVAPSTGAVQVLNQDGFRAETVAMLLADPRLQDELEGAVLLVDEAGLVGTRTMAKLLAIAERQQARVILSGDAGQHHAVERGRALKLLEERAGLKPAGLTEIMRQTGKLKEAVAALAGGRGDEGLERLDSLGVVREIADDAERYRTMAQAYADTLARGQDALAIAPTYAEGQKVVEAIRDELRGRGRLGAEERAVTQLVSANLTEAQRRDPVQYHAGDVVQFVQNGKGGWQRGERATVIGHDAAGVAVRTRAGVVKPLPLDLAGRFQLYRPGEVRISSGDRIRLTLGGVSGGRRMVNGAVHTVTGFTGRGDLALDSGVVLPKEYGHLASGWAITSHAAQGKTVSGRVFIAQGAESLPASSLEQLYVSVSRVKGGAEAVAIFTDDKAALRQAVVRSKRPLSATELLDRPAASPTPRLTERLMTRLRRWKYLATVYAKLGFEQMQQQLALSRSPDPIPSRGLSYGR